MCVCGTVWYSVHDAFICVWIWTQHDAVYSMCTRDMTEIICILEKAIACTVRTVELIYIFHALGQKVETIIAGAKCQKCAVLQTDQGG